MIQKFTLFTLALYCALSIQELQAQIFPNLGGQRAGISALTFLKNDLSPRSVGMGGADVTLTGDAYSINTNSALVSEVKSLTFGISNLSYGGGLQHSAVTSIIPISATQNLTFAVNNLSSGAMEKRTEFQPNGTGELFYVGQTVAGAGYAQQLSEMFSFGGQLKVIHESLAEYRSTTLGVDLGFLYRTDFKHLRFAAALQHFGGNSSLNGNTRAVTFTRSGNPTLDEFAAPTLFKMGVSMRVWEQEDFYLTGALQLNHPNDNAENIRAGLEFVYLEKFILRTGYKINVPGDNLPSAGVAFSNRYKNVPFQIDYAFQNTQFLGNFHSVGIRFSIAKEEKQAAGPVDHE